MSGLHAKPLGRYPAFQIPQPHQALPKETA